MSARGIATLCSWCGHRLHPDTCPGEIQTGTAKQPNPKPCPCARHLKENR